ncbi:MAG: thioesterase family protein [Alphaproteobacteria bacterium]|nr:thioesterase family protein [Alphaproteobacteria bacterium]
MKPHIFPFEIAFADTDAGGIVYHARYVEIAERARMSWLKTFKPAPESIGFAVVELSAKYKKPLRIADDFIVETIVKNVGAASLTVEQKFVKNDEIYAILVIKIACLTTDLKPIRIPAEWHKYF